MKIYKYNNQVYYTLRELYNAIYKQQNISAAGLVSQTDFDDAGIVVEVDELATQSSTNLEEMKQKCLKLLEQQFDSDRASSKIFIDSSLGFRANANITAFNNITGLVLQAEASDQPIAFMDFDDQVQMLTIDQLKKLHLEVSQNASTMYMKKWMYKTSIENATTVDQLQNLTTFEFP